MKKANSKNEKREVAELIVSDEQLGRAKELLRFPVTAEDRIARDRMSQVAYNLSEYEKNVEYYERELSTVRARARHEKLALYKMRKELNQEPVPLESAKAILEEVANLAWVEKVSLDGSYLHIFTRKDMLKTVFDIQLVGLNRPDSWVFEFLEGPVSASMPQYEIRVSLTNMGGSWTTNVGVLALRFSNPDDVAHFDGKGILRRQEIVPHWASNGNNGFEQWQYLCLGEYEDDLTKASAKGLVPFLTELALYLQLSGDQHAYHPKPKWALMIGKKEYAEFNGRLIRNTETQKMLAERYIRDYKIMRQPEGTKEVTVDPEVQAAIVAENALRTVAGARLNPVVTRLYFQDTNILHPTTETCDCDFEGETEPAVVRTCDCGGQCDCHLELVEREIAPPLTFQGMPIIPNPTAMPNPMEVPELPF